MSTPVEHALEPIQKYLDRKDAIEIKIVRFGQVWVELESGEWRDFQVPEVDEHMIRRLGNALGIATEQAFDERTPWIRSVLPGGHRLMMLVGGNVIAAGQGAGVTVAIRLKRNRNVDFADFGLAVRETDYLVDAVKRRRNILVAGGPGSGKTTLTRRLCLEIDDPSPVSIEDVPELDLPQPIATGFLISPVSADTNLNYVHVLDAVIRLRPDRVIIGELNADNGFITLRCLNLGISGIIATLHCDNPSEAISALCELIALKGYHAPEARAFFTRTVHVVVYVERLGSERFVTQIYEPNADGGRLVWERPNVQVA